MATEHQPISGPLRATHLFAVRVWTEDLPEGPQHRGTVRELMTGAFRGFREWSDLVAFIVARVDDQDEPAPGTRAGGEQS